MNTVNLTKPTMIKRGAVPVPVSAAQDNENLSDDLITTQGSTRVQSEAEDPPQSEQTSQKKPTKKEKRLREDLAVIAEDMAKEGTFPGVRDPATGEVVYTNLKAKEEPAKKAVKKSHVQVREPTPPIPQQSVPDTTVPAEKKKWEKPPPYPYGPSDIRNPIVVEQIFRPPLQGLQASQHVPRFLTPSIPDYVDRLRIKVEGFKVTCQVKMENNDGEIKWEPVISSYVKLGAPQTAFELRDPIFGAERDTFVFGKWANKTNGIDAATGQPTMEVILDPSRFTFPPTGIPLPACGSTAPKKAKPKQT